jgi:metallo-beta-lactamase class B
MRMPLLFSLLLSLVSFGWAQTPQTLELEELKPGVYLVRDYLSTQDYGLVDCNGLVYVVDGEALVIDTPHTEALSEALIERVSSELGAKVIGVVIGHTHADSMGGLAAFEKRGIPSYSSLGTQNRAAELQLPIPAAGYQHALEVKVGGKTVRCEYFGPGHTVDNAVTYLVDEKVLFGDCLVKTMGASEGYLGDAVVSEWSRTVGKIRQAHPDVELVVPGHGAPGGPELLDYTITLFER